MLYFLVVLHLVFKEPLVKRLHSLGFNLHSLLSGLEDRHQRTVLFLISITLTTLLIGSVEPAITAMASNTINCFIAQLNNTNWEVVNTLAE